MIFDNDAEYQMMDDLRDVAMRELYECRDERKMIRTMDKKLYPWKCIKAELGFKIDSSKKI